MAAARRVNKVVSTLMILLLLLPAPMISALGAQDFNVAVAKIIYYDDNSAQPFVKLVSENLSESLDLNVKAFELAVALSNDSASVYVRYNASWKSPWALPSTTKASFDTKLSGEKNRLEYDGKSYFSNETTVYEAKSKGVYEYNEQTGNVTATIDYDFKVVKGDTGIIDTLYQYVNVLNSTSMFKIIEKDVEKVGDNEVKIHLKYESRATYDPLSDFESNIGNLGLNIDFKSMASKNLWIDSGFINGTLAYGKVYFINVTFKFVVKGDVANATKSPDVLQTLIPTISSMPTEATPSFIMELTEEDYKLKLPTYATIKAYPENNTLVIVYPRVVYKSDPSKTVDELKTWLSSQLKSSGLNATVQVEKGKSPTKPVVSLPEDVAKTLSSGKREMLLYAGIVVGVIVAAIVIVLAARRL
ncbi:MAG: hypothetical protein F7C35_08720 [Desulfurococcales archaeon]|nr:hypothetical protein [Desulfurococcales archaeon]